MILIAGGAGRLGTLVARRLVDRGLAVRVLTRDARRAAHLVGDRVEIVHGDVRDPASLAAAVCGTDTVVSAVHGFAGPGRGSLVAVDRDGNAALVDEAARAGADFVLVSVVGSSADSPMELCRMKDAAEQHLREAGLPATVVRATAFLELWLDLFEQTAGRSGRPLVFGRGDNPINFVSVRDVAALVELAVTDPTTRGTALEIGGPQDLTFNQLAALVQQARGRSAAVRHVPRPMLQLLAAVAGAAKPALARQARAALVLDRAEMTFDASTVRRAYPHLPCTRAADLLAADNGPLGQPG